MASIPSTEVPNSKTPPRPLAPRPLAFQVLESPMGVMPVMNDLAPNTSMSSSSPTPRPLKRKSSTLSPAPDHFDSVEDAEMYLKRPKGRGRPRKDVAAALHLARDIVQGQQPKAPESALQVVIDLTGKTAQGSEREASAALPNRGVDFKAVRQRIVKRWRLLIMTAKKNRPLVFGNNYRRHLAKLPSAHIYKDMEDELIANDRLPEWAVREMPWRPSRDNAQPNSCEKASNGTTGKCNPDKRSCPFETLENDCPIFQLYSSEL